MEADQDTSNQKSQSQATLEDGGVIIQETEAYKVGHLPACAYLQLFHSSSCEWASPELNDLSSM